MAPFLFLLIVDFKMSIIKKHLKTELSENIIEIPLLFIYDIVYEMKINQDVYLTIKKLLTCLNSGGLRHFVRYSKNESKLFPSIAA